jgi:large subunit ribosomal protein L18e
MEATAVSKASKKSNQALLSLIDDLRDHSRSTGSALWRDIARRLEASRKNWAEPNLSHLSRHAAKKDTILVPGKVLGSGEINPGQTVAAYSFSSGARTKIEGSGGRTLSIRELMEENPNGKGVRILV